MLILNTLFGIDDLLRTKSLAVRTNGTFELIFIAWTLGNFILELKNALLLFIRLEIEIAIKSRRTVRKL